MRKISLIRLSAVIGIVSSISGCTVHPQGERVERDAAASVGKAFEKPIEARNLPPLPTNPTREQLVDFAMQSNGDLERQYWEWRAAIEQIPIDGTQPTSLALSLGTTLNKGSLSLNRTSITAANDPMTDIAFPGKLSAAARRSLENARAAGMRFRKAQLELRRKVLSAYDDCALTLSLIDLDEQNVQLLQTIVLTTQATNRSGTAGQQDVLKASNELDLAKNDLESMRSQLPIQTAILNALLSRPPTLKIGVTGLLPIAHPLSESDQELLDQAAKMNPELTALVDEIRAKHEDVHLAKLQYYPDFDLGASMDLKGITQILMGEFTVPAFRHEALHAAVKQAEANLHASEAMHRRSKYDLAAKLIDDIATLRDADRQIDLMEQTILPRAREVVALGRSRYLTGGEPLTDLINTQRSLIDVMRLAANLRTMRDHRLLDIEVVEASPLMVPRDIQIK